MHIFLRLSLYPLHGFNLITDLNVYATAKLAQSPSIEIGRLTEMWIVNTFGNNPLVVAALKQVLLSSFETMKV